jgi:hypothetical protein
MRAWVPSESSRQQNDGNRGLDEDQRDDDKSQSDPDHKLGRG